MMFCLKGKLLVVCRDRRTAYRNLPPPTASAGHPAFQTGMQPAFLVPGVFPRHLVKYMPAAFKKPGNFVIVREWSTVIITIREAL